MTANKMQEDQEPQLDALTLYKNKPEHLRSMLFRVEKIVLSILGQAQKPMLVNNIRDAYIDRVFYNIVKNLYLDHYYFKIHDMLTNYYKRMALSRTPEEQQLEKSEALNAQDAYERAILLLDSITFRPAAVKEKVLTWLYKDLIFNKKIRKVPFFIGNNTIKSYAEDLERMGVVESRPLGTKPSFYLNGEFNSRWLDERKAMEAKIKEHPEESFSTEDLIFYGLENALLARRIEIAEDVYNKLEPLIFANNATAVKQQVEGLIKKFEVSMGISFDEYTKTDRLFSPTSILTFDNPQAYEFLQLNLVLLVKYEAEFNKILNTRTRNNQKPH